MSIEEKKDKLIEELLPFDDHFERFNYIIDRAKSADPLPEDCKIDTFLIKGCISQLWVFPQFKDGKCIFLADSDASITKGTAGLLCELYSNETPEDTLDDGQPGNETLEDIPVKDDGQEDDSEEEHPMTQGTSSFFLF